MQSYPGNSEQAPLNQHNEIESLESAWDCVYRVVMFAGPTAGGMALGLMTDALGASAPVPVLVGSIGFFAGVGLSGLYHYGIFNRCFAKPVENNENETNKPGMNIQDEDELSTLDNQTRIQII